MRAGALTTIKGVNKVDVVTLGSTFGTLAALMTATTDQLAACPGLGPTKVRRIHDTFHAPFRRTARQLRIQDAVRDGGAGGGGAAGLDAEEAGAEPQQQGDAGDAAAGAHGGGQPPRRQQAPAAAFAPGALQPQQPQQAAAVIGTDDAVAEDDAADAYDDDGYAAAAAAEYEEEDFEGEADAHLYACADPEMSDEDPAGGL
jgi:NAD-dependent DNA ligase